MVQSKHYSVVALALDLVALDVEYLDDHHIGAMVLVVQGVQVVVDCLVSELDGH